MLLYFQIYPSFVYISKEYSIVSFCFKDRCKALIYAKIKAEYRFSVQVSDTTMLNSSTKAKYIKKQPLSIQQRLSIKMNLNFYFIVNDSKNLVVKFPLRKSSFFINC
jgi:hypothetical protein